jgi:hypothetical protein
MSNTVATTNYAQMAAGHVSIPVNSAGDIGVAAATRCN